jgi:hypothetical protein
MFRLQVVVVHKLFGSIFVSRLVAGHLSQLLIEPPENFVASSDGNDVKIQGKHGKRWVGLEN